MAGGLRVGSRDHKGPGFSLRELEIVLSHDHKLSGIKNRNRSSQDSGGGGSKLTVLVDTLPPEAPSRPAPGPGDSALLSLQHVEPSLLRLSSSSLPRTPATGSRAPSTPVGWHLYPSNYILKTLFPDKATFQGCGWTEILYPFSPVQGTIGGFWGQDDMI